MRGLVAIVVTLAVVWCGYWFVGARALDRQAKGWFAAQTDTGLIAAHDGLRVLGFPNRFDLTVNGLHIADPATGIGWTAPFVQVFSLSYRPWHVIAAFPPEQQVQTPLETLTLTSGKLQASAVADPRPALPLNRITLVGDGLALSSSLGWRLVADEVRLASRVLESGGLVHEIGAAVTGLAPDAAVLAPLPGFPAKVETLRLDADLRFSAPLDRHAGQTRPRLELVRLREAKMVWGPLTGTAMGEVAADAQGMAEGRIVVRLTNWRAALPLAVAAGMVTPQVAPTWERALGLLAAGQPDPDTIELPLSFQAGRMSFGPIPLGPAPRMF